MPSNNLDILILHNPSIKKKLITKNNLMLLLHLPVYPSFLFIITEAVI